MRDDIAREDLLLDEARLAARMQHPNIVPTFEGGTHDGALFLAMEYLHGQSFDRVLHALAQHGQALAPELGLRVLCDVLSALEYVHELSDFDGSPLAIVHRDVSPHYILVTYQGEVKLVDFGAPSTPLQP
jgi:serine/threonine protein kinase